MYLLHEQQRVVVPRATELPYKIHKCEGRRVAESQGPSNCASVGCAPVAQGKGRAWLAGSGRWLAGALAQTLLVET
ncbi:hypothetical protein CFIMG_003478RA [Ceratocystis fimbriata CBS 114723]|uniref:Uncharacterized protein n=1 Tax=Ceratocystis fimbriata CBS 114723 TaxID=1035309 RepID=A0A2C5X2G7_9PEZI|nr:hypothetical protein CFIMG_003478RA [Ceratocystis fimbriata CBS 114723]